MQHLPVSNTRQQLYKHNLHPDRTAVQKPATTVSKTIGSMQPANIKALHISTLKKF